jgi:putative membrane protein
LDGVLIAALLCVGASSLLARGRSGGSRRQAALAAGWSIIGLALISPLCNLSVALYSARVVQDLVIMFVGAPLFAFGWGASGAVRSKSLAASTAGFALALWFWNAPALYDATLRNTAVYWAMHASLIAAAVLFWIDLLRAPGFRSVAAVSFTGIQMSALGALLAFAGRGLFSSYVDTTWAWGLSPLADQQLGGVLMWIPSGLLMTIFSVLSLARLFRREAPGFSYGSEGAVAG